MKKTVLIFFTLASSIVLLSTHAVNQFDSKRKTASSHPQLIADGTPMPPLPPKKLRTATAISSDTHLLIADGTPMPPLPPKKLRTATAMRDLETV